MRFEASVFMLSLMDLVPLALALAGGTVVAVMSSWVGALLGGILASLAVIVGVWGVPGGAHAEVKPRAIALGTLAGLLAVLMAIVIGVWRFISPT